MKRLLLFTVALLLFLPAYAQKQLTGSVKDASGELLIGANVIIAGTRSGTVTDINGNFTLSHTSDILSVEVSYVGYKTLLVNSAGISTIHVVLEEDMQSIDEVVIEVGYGRQRQGSISGAISAVGSKEITRRNAPNLSTALQGLMPGVSVVQTSGRPGADGGIIAIRGKGSMNSSTSPLILIDGVESDMNALDMNAVESVSVLKDASAAIYGSRSSNGVVLITTKRGSEQGVKFAYSGYYGVTFPTEMPEPLSGVEFMEYMNRASLNSDKQALFDEYRIDEYRRYGADGWYNFDTDWKKEMLKRNSSMHKHTLNISGGSERINYFVNGSYQFQDGLIDNNTFDRKTLRVNTDLKITAWAKMGLDMTLRNNKEIIPTQTLPDQLIGQALTYSPLLGGINNDGTWGEGLAGYNPIAVARAGGNKETQVTDFSVKGSLSLNPFKGFELYSYYSIRLQNERMSSFIRPYDCYVQGIRKFRSPTGPNSNGRGDEERKNNLYTQFNAQAAYERDIAKHTLKGLAGMQVEYLDSRILRGARTGFYIPGYEEMGVGTENQTTSTAHDQWAMVSYYGRLNYDYADRIILELTGRYEGTSRFINDRWALFPGGSAAWRISEESFFEPLKSTVNYLKLRVSYGHFGNQWVREYYPFTATMLTNSWNGYFFNDTQYLGSIQSVLHNEMISWETSKQFNAGIDIAFLKDRLYVTFDAYRRLISEMLLLPEGPNFVIYKSAFFNIGEMSNTGFDLQMTWKDKVGKFGYSVTGTFSDARSIVEKLTRLTDSGSLNALEVGHPIGVVRGWRTEGFYQSQEDIDNSPAMIEKVNLKPGDVKYRDRDGDGSITWGDIEEMGDGNPRYEYSLNLTAEWNNFDFALFLQGVGKRDKRYNGNGIIPFYSGRSMYRDQLDFWTEDNRDAQFPRLSLDNKNNYYANDFWIKSAAYMRIKNVAVGYRVPRLLLEKIKVDDMRFYVSGQNLFTFKKTFEGFDPEADNSYDSNFYPIMRVITLGVDVRF